MLGILFALFKLLNRLIIDMHHMIHHRSHDRWAECYDLFFPRTDDLSFILQLAEQEGSPVLELACGTGRVCLSLGLAAMVALG